MGSKRLRIRAAQGVIAFALIGAIAVFSPEQGLAPAPAAADELRTAYAIDGDTIESRGRRYRVANIDTPEMGDGANCAAERRLAQRATQRARALLDAANRIEVHPVGRNDRYGRIVAFIRVDGRDFGDVLVAEGLARPWRGRREPWCDAQNRLRR